MIMLFGMTKCKLMKYKQPNSKKLLGGFEVKYPTKNSVEKLLIRKEWNDESQPKLK